MTVIGAFSSPMDISPSGLGFIRSATGTVGSSAASAGRMKSRPELRETAQGGKGAAERQCGRAECQAAQGEFATGDLHRRTSRFNRGFRSALMWPGPVGFT